MQQISGINLNNIPKTSVFASNALKNRAVLNVQNFKSNSINQNKTNAIYHVPINFSSNLIGEDKKKYDFLLNFMKNEKPSQTSGGLTVNNQLEVLLKNGKLLEKNANDKTSILDNLYDIASTERAHDLNKKNLISNTLDAILNPAIITQNFGDIPYNDKAQILSHLNNQEVKNDPSLMDVSSSGTCVAASNEVNLADKYPAEFARWVSKLSSPEKQMTSKIKLSSISKSPLEAIAILNLLKADIKKFTFEEVELTIKPDENAYIRAKNQDKNWDLGERNVADVLVQSTIMNLGSQGTYDSLTDIRAGEFSSNPQGLIEVEKTFVESIIKNKEINSVVNQQIDEEKRLVGFNSSFDKMKDDIIKILDSGDNIILGYVLTNESAGITQSPYYNKAKDGEPNEIINGHEITVLGYHVNDKNETIFECIDTDDGIRKKIEYNASWLIPKINHLGVPASLKIA